MHVRTTAISGPTGTDGKAALMSRLSRTEESPNSQAAARSASRPETPRTGVPAL